MRFDSGSSGAAGDCTHYEEVAGPRSSLPSYRVSLLILAALGVIAAAVLLDVPHLVVSGVNQASTAYEAAPLAVASTAAGLLALWIVAFLPTTLPELSIGYVFGLRVGFYVDFTAKVVGSTISYWLGRSALSSCVRELLDHGMRSEGAVSTLAELFEALAEEATSRPFGTALVMRAAYLPMPLKNYGAALLGIPPVAFFASLATVEILDTYLFVAVGASASDLAALLSGAHANDDSWLRLGLLAVAITATGILLAGMGNAAMATLRARQERRLASRSSNPEGAGGATGGMQSACRCYAIRQGQLGSAGAGATRTPPSRLLV